MEELLKEYGRVYGAVKYPVPSLDRLKQAMRYRGFDIHFVRVCKWIWEQHTRGESFDSLEDALSAYEQAFQFEKNVAIPTLEQLESAMARMNFQLPTHDDESV